MIVIVNGLPGAGKSYWLARRALSSVKTRNVYTSHPVRGCLQLEQKMISECLFPPGSQLVIDEIQTWFNSRTWEKMDFQSMTFFSQHRHTGVNIWGATQNSNRVDKMLREIVEYFVWLRSWSIPMLVTLETPKGRSRCMVKRILVLIEEWVPDFENWGMKMSKAEDVQGFERYIHIVRPGVFRHYNSFDLSQLDEREQVKALAWSDASVGLLPPGVRDRLREWVTGGA